MFAAFLLTHQLFFKALKQRLKIKTFVGTSDNAAQIQVWATLITMVLLRNLRLKSTWGVDPGESGDDAPVPAQARGAERAPGSGQVM